MAITYDGYDDTMTVRLRYAVKYTHWSNGAITFRCLMLSDNNTVYFTMPDSDTEQDAIDRMNVVLKSVYGDFHYTLELVK